MEPLSVALEAKVQNLEQNITKGISLVQGFGDAAAKLPAVRPKFEDTISRALDDLNAKLRVAQGNAEIFGNQFQADKLKVVAYQQALNSLLSSGVSPTSKEVLNLANHIEALSTKLTRQQGILDRQAAKSAQAFKPQEGILQNLQRNIDLYRQKMLRATDTKAIDNYRQVVKNLEQQVAQLTGRTTALGHANAKAAQQANKLSGSANMVGMEFARIIQDAPYGMVGIGNNIQQLSTNFGQLRAQAGSTGGAMKAALAGLISPMSLVTIGISAITAGWVLYEKWQQKAAKATEETVNKVQEARKALSDYVESLQTVDRARLTGARSAQQELTHLKVLYNATQETSLSLENRKKAVDTLQREYPSYFKNLKDEAILAGNAKAQYDALAKSIIATARSRAAEKEIETMEADRLTIVRQISDVEGKLNAARIKASADQVRNAKILERIRETQGSQEAARMALSFAQSEKANQKQINDLVAEKTQLENKNLSIYQEQEKLFKFINREIEKGGLLTEDYSSILRDLNKELEQAQYRKDRATTAAVIEASNVEIAAIQERIQYYHDLGAAQIRLAQLAKEVREAVMLGSAFGNEYAVAAEKAKLYQAAITDLIAKGLKPQSKVITDLTEEFNRLNKAAVLAELDFNTAQATASATAFSTELELAGVKAGLVEQAIQRLIDLKVPADDHVVNYLRQQLDQLRDEAAYPIGISFDAPKTVIYQQYLGELKALQNEYAVFGKNTDFLNGQLKSTEAVITSLLQSGFSPLSEEVTTAAAEMAKLQDALRIEDVLSSNVISMGAAIDILLNKASTSVEKLQALKAGLMEFGTSAFASLGEGLGNMIQGFASGADVLAGVGRALLQTMSQIAAEFGKKLLAIGIGETLMKIPTGPAKIAAGAALIAVAGIGGSFAGGGGRGAAPSVNTSSISGTASGPMGISYEGDDELRFRIEGNDLVAVMDRANYKTRRTRG
jgi:hypothetical protein